MDYKDTLNLPKTDFPMKANLVQKEPELLKRWEAMDVYRAVRKTRAGKSKYVFHDGPPYANGHIHIGHALNKILKDFIVKVMSMKGMDAVYVPGWDCHGLPIEHQVVKELKEKKKEAGRVEIRRLCRDYAKKFVAIQKEEFKRLGVFGDWEKPYLTMTPSYQATIVREFLKFVENGMAYKGSKPVHWCTSCITALAEAEVEYADTTSPSIYVKFAVKSGVAEKLPGVDPAKSYFVIWTTTPWTLPANLAICLNPDFRYVAVRSGGEDYIVAEDRLSALLMEWDRRDHQIIASCLGRDLEGAVARHPFIERDSKVILGGHVTLEQGTGCVHTAPGHGQEDYVVGQKYGLDVYNPVDDHGLFKPEVAQFAGQFVRKANPGIIQLLRDRGAMVHDGQIQHSFPHCWRCRQPIIFRATPQWFISMDGQGLRDQALQAIDQTKWVPHWGRERIYGMVRNRPDWCVSRQRSWGVPIAVFLCKACGETLKSRELFDHVAKIVETEGADFWFERPVAEILPSGTVCKCGGKEFEKESDILDVWFDSGVSHAAVLEKDADQAWPADMYLEGSDQHRGWFHSSLLEAVGTRGRAPYKAVLTHGYVVDGKGRKMSKSLGNVISPEEIMKKYGAEILRLWVASENYREDIRISEEILVRLTEAYRKIRNTFRFLLGNLDGYDPRRDAVPFAQLQEIDRYILLRLKQLCARVMAAYDDYEFHVFYQAFYNFCVVDLSAFYLDILKDRLYTSPRRSEARRSGQTALHLILTSMTRLMAPILSFMAEEIWACLPGGAAAESVFQDVFPDLGGIPEDAALMDRWEKIIAVRAEVSKALEVCRQEKIIGHSLDAEVSLVLPDVLRRTLEMNRDGLKYVFIVSSVRILDRLEEDSAARRYDAETVPGLSVQVRPMGGSKCERCWNYFHPPQTAATGVCPRCADNLEAAKASS